MLAESQSSRLGARQVSTGVVLSLLAVDVTMTAVAVALAYTVRQRIPFPTMVETLPSIPEFLPFIAIQVLSVVVVFYINKLYHLVRATSRVDQVYTIFNAVSIASLLTIAFATLAAVTVSYPRSMLVYAWLLNILLVSIGRWGHQKVRNWLSQQGLGQDRLLVVGTGEIATVVIQKIMWSPYLGYELVGLVSHGGLTEQEEVLGVPIIGNDHELRELIDAYDIDEVIIAVSNLSHIEILEIIARCQRGKVSIRVIPDVFEIMAGEVSVDVLGGLPLLTIRDVALRGWRLSLKRGLDILGASVALISFSPIMLLSAILIKLESPGPAFFVQERVGLDGRPFNMIKFRSMRQDAERISTWTVANDPRRTRIGSFIRKFSIDEMPQFINVLFGDMSLVGPRPEQTRFVADFAQRIPRYAERHREKGGITGWAQINGLRGDTSIDERIKYDLWYIENWSLWLDIKIIVRTLYRGFFDSNAY